MRCVVVSLIVLHNLHRMCVDENNCKLTKRKSNSFSGGLEPVDERTKMYRLLVGTSGLKTIGTATHLL